MLLHFLMCEFFLCAIFLLKSIIKLEIIFLYKIKKLMFSNFKTFEDFVNSQSEESKEQRLVFLSEKKLELKRFITNINKDIFLDLLPIKANKIQFFSFLSFLERYCNLSPLLL